MSAQAGSGKTPQLNQQCLLTRVFEFEFEFDPEKFQFCVYYRPLGKFLRLLFLLSVLFYIHPEITFFRVYLGRDFDPRYLVK